MKKKIEYERSLSAQRPDLLVEWDFEKNGVLKPEEIAEHSGKKVWWKCYKGHSWLAKISARSNGTNCPYCSGKLVVTGITDLQTKRPDLVAQWDYEKNAKLLPTNVSEHSSRKVWWKCQNHHSWAAVIYDRANGSACPYCAGRRPIIGKTDLKTKNPCLAAQWDYENNNGLDPGNVLPFSMNKVWWKCNEGHSWLSSVAHRSNGSGCPYCTGKRPIVGKTDVKTIYPDLVSEWDYEKNKKLAPEDVTISSEKKVWWKCINGHSWEAGIKNRVNGNKCPFCSGKKPIIGETDLKTKHPDLAMQWNYEKNIGLFPDAFTLNSSKKVWWRCEEGHNWEATINNRANGSNCPYCERKLPIVGQTDLKTKYPDLAIIWDYVKNMGLRPEDVTEFSSKKVWWKCPEKHEWQSTVQTRTQNSACPYCNGTKKYRPKEQTKKST